jgi:hypothetical protein
MKTYLITIFFTLLSSYIIAQIDYQEGYFIDNNNKKTACYIKDLGWKNNPLKFFYKTNLNDDYQEATINEVKEFGIIGADIYERHLIEYDTSPQTIDAYSTKRMPVFKKDTVFLKQIVSGHANLYEFNLTQLRLYFYRVEGDRVSQLIFKTYLNDKKQIITNQSYKGQLKLDLVCDDITYKYIDGVGYYLRDLVKLFNRYNKCKNPDFVKDELKEKTPKINITVKAGLALQSATHKYDYGSITKTEIPAKVAPNFSVEFEYVLPIKKNKWSLFLSPTLLMCHLEKFESINSWTEYYYTIDYTSIDLELGFKHYFFLNLDSKLYLQAAIVKGFPINSEFLIEEEGATVGRSYEIGNRLNMNFGTGYHFKNKYSLGIKYAIPRELINGATTRSLLLKSWSILLGYTF